MSASRRAGASLAALLASTSTAARPACRAAIARRAPIRRITSTAGRAQDAEPLPTPPAERAAANVARVQHELSPSSESSPTRSLAGGLGEAPLLLAEDGAPTDWTRSFHGLSATPFTAEQAAILQEPLVYDDIEIKPDGIIYLPEIKYRRILNRAFGPGGWGLAPRGETIVTGKLVTREYGLVCNGRLVSIARGEQQYFDPDGIPTATEGCKSNAMMRCCKDLGIASELWDPRFIRRFLADMARETMVEHVVTKKRRKHWMRKDDEIRYPFRDIGPINAAPASAAPAAAVKPAAPPAAAAKPAATTTAAATKTATRTFTKAAPAAKK